MISKIIISSVKLQIYNLTLHPDLVYDIKGISCNNNLYKFYTSGCDPNLYNGNGSKGLSRYDYYENVDDIYGSPYDDFLSGNDKKNFISSQQGSDVVDYYAGNESIILQNEEQALRFRSRSEGIIGYLPSEFVRTISNQQRHNITSVCYIQDSPYDDIIIYTGQGCKRFRVNSKSGNDFINGTGANQAIAHLHERQGSLQCLNDICQEILNGKIIADNITILGITQMQIGGNNDTIDNASISTIYLDINSQQKRIKNSKPIALSYFNHYSGSLLINDSYVCVSSAQKSVCHLIIPLEQITLSWSQINDTLNFTEQGSFLVYAGGGNDTFYSTTKNLSIYYNTYEKKKCILTMFENNITVQKVEQSLTDIIYGSSYIYLSYYGDICYIYQLQKLRINAGSGYDTLDFSNLNHGLQTVDVQNYSFFEQFILTDYNDNIDFSLLDIESRVFISDGQDNLLGKLNANNQLVFPQKYKQTLMKLSNQSEVLIDDIHKTSFRNFQNLTFQSLNNSIDIVEPINITLIYQANSYDTIRISFNQTLSNKLSNVKISNIENRLKICMMSNYQNLQLNFSSLADRQVQFYFPLLNQHRSFLNISELKTKPNRLQFKLFNSNQSLRVETQNQNLQIQDLMEIISMCDQTSLFKKVLISNGLRCDRKIVIYQGCNPYCMNCSTEFECISCNSSLQRVLIGTQCICMDGYFDDGKLQCQCKKIFEIECHSICKTCSQRMEICTSCKQSLMIIEKNVCICPKRYFYNQTETKCLECIPNCYSCSDPINCESCEKNYILQSKTCICQGYQISSQGKTCISCPKNCQTCSQTDVQSIECLSCSQLNQVPPLCSCVDGFYSNENQCEICSYKCQSCLSQSLCLICSSNRSTPPICGCQQGYYEKGNQCLKCPDECQKCQAAGCITCSDNNKLPPDCNECSKGYLDFRNQRICQRCSNQNCLICEWDSNGQTEVCSKCSDLRIEPSCQCRSRYFQREYTCEACKTNCEVCDTEGCIRCEPPRIGKQCFCPVTQFELDGLCYTCGEQCAVCLDSITCIKCNLGTFFISGKCVLQCPTSYYQNNQECKACSENCYSCLDQHQCTQCIKHSFLYLHKCYPDCFMNGYHKDEVQLKCKDCGLGCKRCKSYLNCQICYGEYFLIQGKCYSECAHNQLTNCSLCKLNNVDCVNKLNLIISIQQMPPTTFRTQLRIILRTQTNLIRTQKDLLAKCGNLKSCPLYIKIKNDSSGLILFDDKSSNEDQLVYNYFTHYIMRQIGILVYIKDQDFIKDVNGVPLALNHYGITKKLKPYHSSKLVDDLLKKIQAQQNGGSTLYTVVHRLEIINYVIKASQVIAQLFMISKIYNQEEDLFFRGFLSVIFPRFNSTEPPHLLNSANRFETLGVDYMNVVLIIQILFIQFACLLLIAIQIYIRFKPLEKLQNISDFTFTLIINFQEGLIMRVFLTLSQSKSKELNWQTCIFYLLGAQIIICQFIHVKKTLNIIRNIPLSILSQTSRKKYQIYLLQIQIELSLFDIDPVYIISLFFHTIGFLKKIAFILLVVSPNRWRDTGQSLFWLLTILRLLTYIVHPYLDYYKYFLFIMGDLFLELNLFRAANRLDFQMQPFLIYILCQIIYFAKQLVASIITTIYTQIKNLYIPKRQYQSQISVHIQSLMLVNRIYFIDQEDLDRQGQRFQKSIKECSRSKGLSWEYTKHRLKFSKPVVDAIFDRLLYQKNYAQTQYTEMGVQKE